MSSTAKHKRYLGCHVSTAGGFEKGLANAKTLGVNTIQLHPSPPQRWNRTDYPKGYEDKFVAARSESGVEKLFFHAVYLINLATPDDEKFELSVSSLTYYLDLLGRVEGDGVIVHVGSLKDQPNPDIGYQRAADGIRMALDRADNGSRLLLEVAAGSGKIIGARVQELAGIAERVGAEDRLGFALDSQHLWASGYDLRNNLKGLVAELEKYFGFDRIGAIHLNDSKTDCGSNRDRHENLGGGLIGREALANFINAPALRTIPVILETPGLKDLDTAASEVAVLRELAGNS